MTLPLRMLWFGKLQLRSTTYSQSRPPLFNYNSQSHVMQEINCGMSYKRLTVGTDRIMGEKERFGNGSITCQLRARRALMLFNDVPLRTRRVQLLSKVW